jgi:hypothetical protein
MTARRRADVLRAHIDRKHQAVVTIKLDIRYSPCLTLERHNSFAYQVALGMTKPIQDAKGGILIDMRHHCSVASAKRQSKTIRAAIPTNSLDVKSIGFVPEIEFPEHNSRNDDGPGKESAGAPNLASKERHDRRDYALKYAVPNDTVSDDTPYVRLSGKVIRHIEATALFRATTLRSLCINISRNILMHHNLVVTAEGDWPAT